LELRTFYYDPGYCLSSGGSPTVLAMTIRSNTDLGRRAETHLATITATSNSILFHAGHRKLGMSNRNRDNLLVGEPRKRVQEIIADNLSKAGWSWGCPSNVGLPAPSDVVCSAASVRRLIPGKVRQIAS
jgi:hypothetical protein